MQKLTLNKLPVVFSLGFTHSMASITRYSSRNSPPEMVKIMPTGHSYGQAITTSYNVLYCIVLYTVVALLSLKMGTILLTKYGQVILYCTLLS